MAVIPTYSDEALASLDLFHRDQVGAIFYFEDQGAEAFYERLISKLFPSITRFWVVCLGGKTQVIAKARSVDQKNAHEASLPVVEEIFILDKDFDDILGTWCTIDRVFYLRRHSIENYLFQPEAIVQIALESAAGKLTRKDIAEKCTNLTQYVSDLKHSLIQMTRHFVLARRYSVPVTTSKMKLEALLEFSEEMYPMPVPLTIAKYRQTIMSHCVEKANDWLTVDEAFDHELARPMTSAPGVPAPTASDEDQIVGKHLLRCLVRYLTVRLHVRLEDIDYVELYMRLVNVIDLSPLSFLSAAVHGRFPSLAPAK